MCNTINTCACCFSRTKMLDTHELECILKADMKNLPADVQRGISKRDLTTLKCHVSGFLNGIARDDPNEVVHEMVLAVRETDPKAIYTAGNQMECLFRYIFGVVPTELTDAWLSLLETHWTCPLATRNVEHRRGRKSPIRISSCYQRCPGKEKQGAWYERDPSTRCKVIPENLSAALEYFTKDELQCSRQGPSQKDVIFVMLHGEKTFVPKRF
ncbi:17-beta-hydroxysteroid dehydrogenase type 6-like [Ixodes scapularis]